MQRGPIFGQRDRIRQMLIVNDSSRRIMGVLYFLSLRSIKNTYFVVRRVSVGERVWPRVLRSQVPVAGPDPQDSAPVI